MVRRDWVKGAAAGPQMSAKRLREASMDEVGPAHVKTPLGRWIRARTPEEPAVATCGVIHLGASQGDGSLPLDGARPIHRISV
jgi:hypothetical protein